MFLRNYNEDVELNLGIGINYGQIYFSYLGAPALSLSQDGRGSNPGHLEFTALGDHVNTAERLEGIASKYVGDINLVHRGDKFKNEAKIRPIVMSQTVSHRLIDIFFDDEEELKKRRGIAQFKGKGVALPFFEIEESLIDTHHSNKILKDVSNGQYFDSIQNPPPIEKYVECLNTNLEVLGKKSTD